jgi:diamine N-acetyltransferase
MSDGVGQRATVTLVEATADNWRDAAALDIREEQRAFVAPVTFYLSLCAYSDGPWHPLLIVSDATPVGFVMEGVDPDDGSFWIGGLVIDATMQHRGLGTAAVTAMIERARSRGHDVVALSVHPDNDAAQRLYDRLGFVTTDEREGDEIVRRLTITR